MATAMTLATAGADGFLGFLDDGVSRFDGDVGVDLDMNIDHQHVAHLARAHIMDATHTGGFLNRVNDLIDLLL